MKRKVITTTAITLFLASMFTITSGVAPVTAKANRYVHEDWQSIGPGFIILDLWARTMLEKYYGEPVYINYDVTNTWTIHVTSKDDLHLTSQQNGIADIFDYGPDETPYTSDDELLDTRAFFCHEIGIDRGMDNGDWNLVVSTWYDLFDFFAGPDAFANLEYWNIEWKIQGLYLFKATVIDGECVQCEHGVSHEWVHP